ncbi:OCIA domain-containing protein 2 isoform X1 [Caretta caretta]|uniref:OCIA domain-containing protein 2 isoform X1 n=1 Tax=Caretta caretta TaxID=8467 RepID=UPI002095CC03|nr:OCIA domain-containing protein 2 isoform X1 [Caretta caretta]XP_048704306.1 OCIA domain-containing protein 2 isoform X1 [Caretta caretta]
MSSETAQSKVQASSQQQNKQSGFYCPISDAHINRKEVERISRECRNESFWYRGLPLSLGSMLITQGLIYNGFLSSNPRFGSLPKIACTVIIPARNAKQILDLMERKTQSLQLHNPRSCLFFLRSYFISWYLNCRTDKILQKKSLPSIAYSGQKKLSLQSRVNQYTVRIGLIFKKFAYIINANS